MMMMMMHPKSIIIIEFAIIFLCGIINTGVDGFSISSSPWGLAKPKVHEHQHHRGNTKNAVSQLFMAVNGDALNGESPNGDDDATYNEISKPTNKRSAKGGRAARTADQLTGAGAGSSGEWTPTPCQPDEARLTVIQITDTYTLEHLPSVKTLLKDVREKTKGSTVISCMTGDFLAPYLLSSVDRGQGMMNALKKIPIDYLSWGNHEVREMKKQCYRKRIFFTFFGKVFTHKYHLLFVVCHSSH